MNGLGSLLILLGCVALVMVVAMAIADDMEKDAKVFGCGLFLVGAAACFWFGWGLIT